MNRFSCKCLLPSFFLVFLAFSTFGANFEKLPDFEKEIVSNALKEKGLNIDRNPEKKLIRNYYFYTASPFKATDKLLSWVDKVSFSTKNSALRAQLWVNPGETYNSQIITENEQILLNPGVRSFALIFPVQEADKESDTQVDLLVVSKDVFSWQGTLSASSAGNSLSNLSLGLAQTNLFGLNKTLGASFVMGQQLINLSTYYIDPIFLSTKNQLKIQQGLFLNKDGLKYEGIHGLISFTYPLLVESAKWGYSASFSYTYQPVFDFQGSEIRKFQDQERKYRKLILKPVAKITRSFGATDKNNLSFGYGFQLERYEAMEAVNQAFKDKILPKDERESYLIFEYKYFQNKFLTLSNYNTFSMTEWLSLGPSVSLSNHLGLGFLGSENYFYRPKILIAASIAPNKDSWLSLSTHWQSRIQNTLVNNQASATATAISPELFKFGRFVSEAIYSQVWDNIDNSQFTLGGDSGLRGAPLRYYQGDRLLRTNLEFRTTSLPFWIFRLGLVGFYDFGAAFNSKADFNPTHDLGLGIRILTIPWSRQVIRIDFATPVSGPLKGFNHTLVSFGFGQAF